MARLLNLIAPMSDHAPILLQCSPTAQTRGPCRFRFESSWLHEYDINDVVTEGRQAVHDGHILARLGGCTEALIAWSKRLRMRFRDDIDQCKKRLVEFRGVSGTEAYREMDALNTKLCSLLVQEETFWRQRAKSFWLRDGDTNLRYFHAPATTHRKKNHIPSLLNDENVEVASPSGMCTIAGDYFTNLFTCKNGVYAPVLDKV